MLLFPVLDSGTAAAPPMIPVGLDAYRLWDRWPCQRIGARAYMRSTYDRRGGNEGADQNRDLLIPRSGAYKEARLEIL